MRGESELISRLHTLRMQLEIARENDYEFMQQRIEGEIASLERVMSDLSDPEREE